jgi:hypothetical protein
MSSKNLLDGKETGVLDPTASSPTLPRDQRRRPEDHTPLEDVQVECSARYLQRGGCMCRLREQEIGTELGPKAVEYVPGGGRNGARRVRMMYDTAV